MYPSVPCGTSPMQPMEHPQFTLWSLQCVLWRTPKYPMDHSSVPRGLLSIDPSYHSCPGKLALLPVRTGSYPYSAFLARRPQWLWPWPWLWLLLLLLLPPRLPLQAV